MQARARVRYLKMSPQKMRQVAELVKGKPVEEALNILNYTPKIAAHHLAKTVKAAAANAIASVGTAKLKAEDLAISRIIIDGGPIVKRIRFQSMGRAHRIRKRYCHLTIEVEGEPEPESPKARTSRKKKEAAEKAAAEEKKQPSKTGKAAAGGRKKKVKAEEKKAKIEDKEVLTELSEEIPEGETVETEEGKSQEKNSEE